jgi:hypothetical protein
MPIYLYQCPEKHEEVISHSIGECNIPRFCVLCKGEMHRVPQQVIHYNNPNQTLLNKLHDSFIDKKARNDKWRRRRMLGKIID